jgi:hypothetical protein
MLQNISCILRALWDFVFGLFAHETLEAAVSSGAQTVRMEAVECRQMLAVSANLSSGLLTVNNDSQTRLTVEYNSSKTQIVARIGSSYSRSFSKSSVKSIKINGGSKAEYIGLSDAIKVPATISGNGGNDTIFSGGGNDSIYGGEGSDRLSGRTGNDLILGGNGNDTLDGGSGSDRADGGEGNDKFISTEARPTTSGSNTGSSDNDVSPPTSSTSKVTAGFYDGINVTGGADASRVIPRLRELGISGVRIWVGMKTWSHRGNGQAFLQARMYKDAGFKVMMNVGVPETSSESNYQGFFNWLKSQKYFKSVDMIQVGNEPNHYKSWNGGIDGYMKMLKIAHNTLHPTGMKILGAGPTYDVEACKELVKQGYLNYVDYAGFHPYGNSPEQVISRLKAARDVYGSKPLIVSEWNVRNQPNASQWAASLKKVREEMARYCNAAYYFSLVKGGSMAGPAGVFANTSWSPNDPFYSAVKSFAYMEGGSK